MNAIVEKALLKFKKAKRIAVENATMGITQLDMATSINLESDIRSYNWNADTVKAIYWVIQEQGKQS
jgi:hypothetical protein